MDLFGSNQDSRVFRALSLWQPHATAIALGIKLYETRHWSTDYRGPLVIHSAKKPFRHQGYELSYYQEACRRLHDAGCPQYALRYGVAVCLVDLVDCVKAESVPAGKHRFWGDFSEGRYAFKLENVRRIYPELRAVGRQKFFSIEIPEGNEALARPIQITGASQSQPDITGPGT